MNPHLPPAHPAPTESVQSNTCEPLSADEFAALEAILSYLRSRHDAIPTWEFCEGFMAALICCRRPIPPEEYLPVLLAVPFANAVQQRRFMSWWTRGLTLPPCPRMSVPNAREKNCPHSARHGPRVLWRWSPPGRKTGPCHATRKPSSGAPRRLIWWQHSRKTIPMHRPCLPLKTRRAVHPPSASNA